MNYDQIQNKYIVFDGINGNIEIGLTEPYMIDLKINENVYLKDLSVNSIGLSMNNTADTVQIKTSSNRIIIILTGTNSVGVFLKKGNLTSTPKTTATGVLTNSFNVLVGLSFRTINFVNKSESTNLTDQITSQNTTLNTHKSALNTFKEDVLEDVNSLLADDEKLLNIDSLLSPYSHNNTTYPKFAYIDQITSTNRDIYLDDDVITTDNIVNENITYDKFESGLKTSINKANSALQKIVFNNLELTKTDKAININALTKLSIVDGLTSHNYEIGTNTGTIVINDWNTYMQPLMLGTADNVVYFSANNVLGEKPMSDFVLKSDIIHTALSEISNTKMASTLLTKTLLDEKVDTLQTPLTPLIDNSFVNLSVNSQGLVSGYTAVEQSDLTNLLNIDNSYQKTGVKSTLNTSRLTVFFM